MGRAKRKPHFGDAEGIIMYKHTQICSLIYIVMPLSVEVVQHLQHLASFYI